MNCPICNTNGFYQGFSSQDCRNPSCSLYKKVEPTEHQKELATCESYLKESYKKAIENDILITINQSKFKIEGIEVFDRFEMGDIVYYDIYGKCVKKELPNGQHVLGIVLQNNPCLDIVLQLEDKTF